MGPVFCSSWCVLDGSALLKGCFHRPDDIDLALPVSELIQNMSVDRCVDVCTQQVGGSFFLSLSRLLCRFHLLSRKLTHQRWTAGTDTSCPGRGAVLLWAGHTHVPSARHGEWGQMSGALRRGGVRELRQRQLLCGVPDAGSGWGTSVCDNKCPSLALVMSQRAQTLHWCPNSWELLKV